MNPPAKSDNRFCPFLPWIPRAGGLAAPNQQTMSPMVCFKEKCAVYDEDLKKCGLVAKVSVDLEHREIKNI